MGKCSLQGCENSRFKNKDCAFFSVPKEPTLREQWMKFAKWKEVRNHYRLCENHFAQGDITKRFPRPLLKRGAIPSIGLPVKNTVNEKPDTTTDVQPSISQDKEGNIIIKINAKSDKEIVIAENEKETTLCVTDLSYQPRSITSHITSQKLPIHKLHISTKKYNNISLRSRKRTFAGLRDKINRVRQNIFTYDII